MAYLLKILHNYSKKALCGDRLAADWYLNPSQTSR
jgi:hypothetical protein